MLKRRLKLLGKIVLGLIVLLVAFLIFERLRGQIALASYKKELLAKGVKLSPQDFIQTFHAEDNGAPAAIAAIESLTNGTVLPGSTPPLMRLLPSGRAIIGFLEPEWVEAGHYRDEAWIKGPVTNSWGGVAADLQTNASVIAAVRAALEYPVLNNHMEFSNPLKFQFLHLPKPKTVAFWLGASVQLMLREGRLTNARKDLDLTISLPRLLAEDHLAISELVRIAIAAFARAHTWEALQVREWADEDLATIQTAWAKQTFSSNMTHALEGELVFIAASIQEMRKSNDETYNLLFGAYVNFLDSDQADATTWMKRIEGLPGGEALIEFWRKQVYCRLWRLAWSHQAEERMLRNMTEMIRLARAATRNASYQTIEDDMVSLLKRATDKGVYDRLRFPPPESIASLGKTIQKALRAETDRALTITAIALQRYQLRHGAYPEQLNELMPEFLAVIPTDYMDGKPIKYQREAANAFTLYSVGENGRDDGGDLTPTKTSGSRDLWYRRDYVWPAPATPEEVAEYRRETAAQK